MARPEAKTPIRQVLLTSRSKTHKMSAKLVATAACRCVRPKLRAVSQTAAAGRSTTRKTRALKAVGALGPQTMHDRHEQFDTLVVDVEHGAHRVAGQEVGVVPRSPAVTLPEGIGGGRPGEVERIVDVGDGLASEEDPRWNRPDREHQAHGHHHSRDETWRHPHAGNHQTRRSRGWRGALLRRNRPE